MLKIFKSSLEDYKSLLSTAEMQDVNMEQAVNSGKYLYDYKFNKAKYLADNMKKRVQELKKIITELYSESSNPSLGEQYSKIMINVKLLAERYYDPKRSLPIVETIEKQLKPLEQDEFLRKAIEEVDNQKENGKGNKELDQKKEAENMGEKEEQGENHVPVEEKEEPEGEKEATSPEITPEEMDVELPDIQLPFLPEEIQSNVAEDINELERCYNSGCYRSSVILCGRIMEAALHRKYFEKTGKDALEKNPGIGLGKLIAKLSEQGVKFDPGLKNQIHLINQVRIGSVHVKQDLYKPNQTQTQAIVLYTLDVLHKLFGN